MRRPFAKAAPLLVLAVALAARLCFAGEVDALGEVIAANSGGARPARIVTLAPSLGELMAALDSAHLERIVGVSEYTDYPPALKKAESIGPYNRFNLEKVVALKPDLVLATKDGNAEDQVRHLKELGLRVVVVDTTSLNLVARSMRQIGIAAGVEASGERMAEDFEAGLKRAREHAKSRPRRSVLLQLGDEPLIVAGGEAFLSEALAAVGAKNAYGDSQSRYPRPLLEDALARDPDAIIILAMGDAEPFEKMAKRWEGFSKLKAVKARRVKVLQADTLLRPTMRLLDGIWLLEEAVYGP